MKTYLNVPYEERNEAKRLGAFWDGIEKKWYVKNIEDLSPFLRWMPKHLLRSPEAFLESMPKPKLKKTESKKKLNTYGTGFITGPYYKPDPPLQHGESPFYMDEETILIDIKLCE